MITYQILEEDSIVIIEPKGPLSTGDFQQLTADVDLYLTRAGSLKGILVHAIAFPGWEDFKGMVSHLRFVRDHHRLIKRVALASDSMLAEIMPKLVSHFVNAEVRGFAYEDRDAALEWLREAE